MTEFKAFENRVVKLTPRGFRKPLLETYFVDSKRTYTQKLNGSNIIWLTEQGEIVDRPSPLHEKLCNLRATAGYEIYYEPSTENK